MKKKFLDRTFFEGVAFFAITSVITTVVALVCPFVIEESGGDTAVVALVMLLVVLLLSTLFTCFSVLYRKVNHDLPAKQIVAATDRIARGDFSVRLAVRHEYVKYDSYDVIMDNVNKMAEELQKMAILKTDFLSGVSHELKTPLAIIKNDVFLLQKGKLTEEEKEIVLLSIGESCDRLSSLVTNVLKLNKLENQTAIVEKTTFDLTASLSECLLSMEPLIEKKNIEIETDLDDVKITSCQEYLEIVWNNLFSNAIKFTNEGGKIFLSLKKEKSLVVVKITDTGCGIDRETVKRIFDKFYQGETSHQKEGNGLGLALVKKVIDVLGGSITVASELKKGTTFTVTLKDGV